MVVAPQSGFLARRADASVAGTTVWRRNAAREPEGKRIPYELAVRDTSFHKSYSDAGLDWWNDLLIIEALAGSIGEELQIVLDDHLPKSLRFKFDDAKLGMSYRVEVTSRLLGRDTGNSVLIHIGRQLRIIFGDQRRATRAITESEMAKVAAIRSRRGAHP